MTAVHLIANTPELSQRLFGGLNIKTVTKTNKNNNAQIVSSRCMPVSAMTATTTVTTSKAQIDQPIITAIQQQQQHQHQKQIQMPVNINEKNTDTSALSPSISIGGLKVKVSLQNNLVASEANIANTTTITVSTVATSSPIIMTLATSSLLSSTTSSALTSTSIMTTNSNSLLKQQLRLGLKDMNCTSGTDCDKDDIINASSNNQHNNIHDANNLNGTILMNSNVTCTALQSLANAAERQSNNNNNNNIQPPTSNNLHHQFILHMAANPMIKSSGELDHYFMQKHGKDTQQQHRQEQEQLKIKDDNKHNDDNNNAGDKNIDNDNEHNIDMLLDQYTGAGGGGTGDKSDSGILTLTNENVVFDYMMHNNDNSTTTAVASIKPLTTNTSPINNNCDDGKRTNNKKPLKIVAKEATGTTATANRTKNQSSTKPIQRRRIRRKAQSSLDDPAEQLTEMSVRGLDLFRYASINEGVYQCTECAKENLQKTFKNKYSFQRHAFLYHEGKQRKVFPCTLCGKGFSRPDKMKNHIKMVHDVIHFNSLNYIITAATAIGNDQTSTVGPVSSSSVSTTTTTKNGKSMNASNRNNSTLSGNNQQSSFALQPCTQSIIRNERTQSPRKTASSKNEYNTMTPSGTEKDSESKFPSQIIEDENISANIEIKNEIIISPSPSPPPLTIFPTTSSLSPSSLSAIKHKQYTHSFTTMIDNETKSLLNITKSQASQQTSGNATAQLSSNAQRLAEVI